MPGASSESVDEGDDLLGQVAALVEHLGVGGGDGAQDELAGAGGAVSLEQIDDRLGVADGHVGARLGLAAGAGGERLDAALDVRLLPAAEAEADTGAVVVVLDDPAEGAGALLDRGDDAADLGGRLGGAGDPAVAEARRALDRRLAAAAGPDRQGLLPWLWAGGRALLGGVACPQT